MAAAAGLVLLGATCAAACATGTVSIFISAVLSTTFIPIGNAGPTDSAIITTFPSVPPLHNVSSATDAAAAAALSATATPAPPAKCCQTEGQLLALDNFTQPFCAPDATPPPGAPPAADRENATSEAELCGGEFGRRVFDMSALGDAFTLREDGTLLLLREDAAGVQPLRLKSEEFCADRLEGSGDELVIACLCQEVRCVSKCCFSNAMLHVPLREDYKCVGVGEGARAGEGAMPPPPPFALAPGPPLRLLPGKPPVCQEGEFRDLLNVYPDHPLRSLEVLADGSLRLGGGAGAPEAPLRPGSFCVERARLYDGSVVGNTLYCVRGASGERKSFYPVLLVCGALFLLLTLCVYALVPEVGSKPHARALMCHCGAMLVAFVTLVPLQLGLLPHQGPVCYAAVILVQFGMLASFFWLNVLCIDIAWTFRAMQSGGCELRPQRRRLLLGYSLYAWGGAAAVAGATAALDAAAQHLPPSIPRPYIAVTHCWFNGFAAMLLYYYGPLAVLLLANVALFVYTAVLLGAELRRRKDLHELQAAGGRPHGADALSRNRDRLAVYVKLFCLMGGLWVTEIISWAEGSQSSLWMAADAVNALRGVGVFVLFCCKRRVLRQLRARLACGWSRGCCAPSTPGTATNQSSSTSTEEPPVFVVANANSPSAF